MDNCKTCLYANSKGDLVVCDRRLLLDGKEVVVETSKIGLSCPCHSSRFIDETRYMRDNKDLRDADDSCGICGRLIDMLNSDNYEYVIEEVAFLDKDENGEEIEIIEEHIICKCKICIDKGRNLLEQK